MFSVDALLHQYLPPYSRSPWCKAMLRRLLYENDFQQFSTRYPQLTGLDFVEQVLSYFDFACEVDNNELEHIPAHGPVVLVANHPIGTLDGMALLRVVARVRPDVRIVANQVLSHVEALSPLLLPVDNMSNRTGRQQIEALHQHLAEGKALIRSPPVRSRACARKGCVMAAGTVAFCAWRPAPARPSCRCMCAAGTRHCFI